MDVFETLESNSAFERSAVAPIPDQEPLLSTETFRLAFDAVCADLAEDYQPGTRDFCQEHNPGLLAELQSVDDAMVAAWRRLDFPVFEGALTQWRGLHIEAIALFDKYQDGPDSPVERAELQHTRQSQSALFGRLGCGEATENTSMVL